MSVRKGRRAGFTMVELLVSIGIIALVAGLTLPAIQQAREAANRASCASNLKQITLALHHYHNDFQVLPPSRLGEGQATWAVLLMPYMEEQSPYELWDLKKTYYEQNDSARLSAVQNYFCPSRRTAGMDPQTSISGDQPQNCPACPNLPGALGDYACCIGTTGMDHT